MLVEQCERAYRKALRACADILDGPKPQGVSARADLADELEGLASKYAGLAAVLRGLACQVRGACQLCQGMGRIGEDIPCWECDATGFRKEEA